MGVFLTGLNFSLARFVALTAVLDQEEKHDFLSLFNHFLSLNLALVNLLHLKEPQTKPALLDVKKNKCCSVGRGASSSSSTKVAKFDAISFWNIKKVATGRWKVAGFSVNSRQMTNTFP